MNTVCKHDRGPVLKLVPSTSCLRDAEGQRSDGDEFSKRFIPMF